jgi:alpha-tubulin suppressor-like RCC1 family protein
VLSANSNGQLGDNTQTDRGQPVALVLAAAPISVACGRAHTCALDNTGKVACWGRNFSGELGLGDYNSPRTTPQPVPLPGNAVLIFAGGYATCAELTGGKVVCWGDGERGQLGNGMFATSDVPIEAAAMDSTALIELDRGGGCFQLSGGSISCFGSFWLFGNGDNSDAVPMSPSFTCAQ